MMRQIFEGEAGTEWRQDGVLHRDGAPAIIHNDGDGEGWYQHGRLHRIGAPAMHTHFCLEGWYEHDQLHRVAGPAMVFPNGDNIWSVRGRDITEQVDAWHADNDVPAWRHWRPQDHILFRLWMPC